MEKLHWTNLRVTDSDGDDIGALGDCINDGTVSTEYIMLRDDGSLDSWPDYFISAPGEEPEWDTPHVPVDWTGFANAVKN